MNWARIIDAIRTGGLSERREVPKEAPDERREEYESWVRCLDAEKAAGHLTDAEYEAERLRYAHAYGIERCPYCGAEPNIRCCEFGRDK